MTKDSIHLECSFVKDYYAVRFFWEFLDFQVAHTDGLVVGWLIK